MSDLFGCKVIGIVLSHSKVEPVSFEVPTRGRVSLSLCILTLCLAVSRTWGQFGGMNAEFAGGGARALAMGGAFIALADDATATEFNPAGLWQLRRPEVSAQVIYVHEKREVPLSASSYIKGEAIFGDEEDRYWIPSFASFVYPMQHLTVGISEFTNIYFDRSFGDPLDDFERREKGENYAYGLTLSTGVSDYFSVGSTVRYNQFRYHYDDPHPRFGGEGSFESGAPSANIGFIWRTTPKIRVGAVYKSPQDLEGDYRGLDVDTELPQTLGVGLALLPNQRWRLLFDVDRIWWSDFDPNPNDQFVKEDLSRYHLGMEWYASYWKGTDFFLRAGYHYEESNAYQYEGENPIFQEFASKDDPIRHYTLGVGMARRRYQLDFGLDVTEEHGADLIMSTVWYF